MKIGDMVVVRYGAEPSLVRMRIALVSALEPLSIRLCSGPYGGMPARVGKNEFRPRWAKKVHAVPPEVIVREATRREVILGRPDPTIGLGAAPAPAAAVAS